MTSEVSYNLANGDNIFKKKFPFLDDFQDVQSIMDIFGLYNKRRQEEELDCEYS
jgi:hypothetical protein